MIEVMRAVSWEVVGLALVVVIGISVWRVSYLIRQSSKEFRDQQHSEALARLRIQDQKAISR